MVGAERFELSTPSPPDWCANRAALRSERRDYSDAVAAAQPTRPRLRTGRAGRSDAAPDGVATRCLAVILYRLAVTRTATSR